MLEVQERRLEEARITAERIAKDEMEREMERERKRLTNIVNGKHGKAASLRKDVTYDILAYKPVNSLWGKTYILVLRPTTIGSQEEISIWATKNITAKLDEVCTKEGLSTEVNVMVFPSNLEIRCNGHGVWKSHSFPFVDIGIRLEEKVNISINFETKDIPIVPKEEQKVWKALSC